MLKLSDPLYRLPIVEALSAFELFETGSTRPLAVWAVDIANGTRNQYVVKFKNANRMTPSSSAFELIGAWMAKELNLPAAEPVLVKISSDFIELCLKGKDGYKAAYQSQGINFGSKYKAGFTFIPQKISLSEDMLEMVKMIYVFDVFISNMDRGHQKPNIASNGNELFIYDHELSFSFLRILPFLRNKAPWILNESDREVYKNHYFYSTLKGSGMNFQQQVEKLECFNPAFWGKVYETLPTDWINEDILEIGPHLTSIVENYPYFTASLNKTVTL